jgi:hypothetical protein
MKALEKSCVRRHFDWMLLLLVVRVFLHPKIYYAMSGRIQSTRRASIKQETVRTLPITEINWRTLGVFSV